MLLPPHFSMCLPGHAASAGFHVPAWSLRAMGMRRVERQAAVHVASAASSQLHMDALRRVLAAKCVRAGGPAGTARGVRLRGGLAGWPTSVCEGGCCCFQGGLAARGPGCCCLAALPLLFGLPLLACTPAAHTVLVHS